MCCSGSISAPAGWSRPLCCVCCSAPGMPGLVAALIAGWTGRPGLVLGVGMTLAVAGYVAVALFPLAGVLKPWRHASPWDWALGGDPLTGTTDAWRYLALGVPAVLLILAGGWLFGRRDVKAA